MHPNELFHRDLLEDKDLLLAFAFCLTHLSPEFQKRRIGGAVVELKPNQAIVDLPLRLAQLSQVEFEENLKILGQLDLVRTVKKDSYFIVEFPKIRVDAIRKPIDVDESHPDTPAITFEAFSVRYLQQVECDTSPKNLENSQRVCKHANKHFGNILLAKLEPRHLEEFKQKRLEEIRAKRGQSAGKTTVNMDVRTLKRALEDAIDWGYLKENPFRRIKSIKTEAKKPLAMTPEEFNEMLLCVEDEQLKKFFQLAVLTGMRRGELLYLKWENVNFELATIFIESSPEYRVKHGGGRSLPITDQVGKILRSLERNDPYVFMNQESRPYTEDYVTKKFKEAVREAVLNDKFHLHCLRHTFATWLSATKDVNMVVIKDILGHAYVKTTEAYVQAPTTEMRKAMDQLTLPPS